LIYGTGGAAFAHASSQSLDFSESARAVVFEGSCVEKSFFHAANTFSASANQSMLGWAIGAGIDWKWQVDARSAWVFGVEYQYFNFPTRVAPTLTEKLLTRSHKIRPAADPRRLVGYTSASSSPGAAAGFRVEPMIDAAC
jgi:opacity protein-like surface antigen